MYLALLYGQLRLNTFAFGDCLSGSVLSGLNTTVTDGYLGIEPFNRPRPRQSTCMISSLDPVHSKDADFFHPPRGREFTKIHFCSFDRVQGARIYHTLEKLKRSLTFSNMLSCSFVSGLYHQRCTHRLS